MRYFLINIDAEEESMMNRLMQIYILKDAAYNAIIADKEHRQLHYSYIMVPLLEYDEGMKNELERYNSKLNLHYDITDVRTNSYNLSIGSFIEKGLRGAYPFDKFCESYRFRISLIVEIDEDMFSVTYTDGSICAKTKKTGWAAVRVKDPDPENGLLDVFTDRKCAYETSSGKLSDGTNNIGELTAIENATHYLSNKFFQVIISDCDYGMKSLRQYIHEWRKNRYKNGTVKNLELMRQIDKNVTTSQKIFLFKWTESHIGYTTPFNVLCDIVAKKESGVLTESEVDIEYQKLIADSKLK